MSHSLQHYISFFIQALRRKPRTATKIEKQKGQKVSLYVFLILYNQAPPNGLPHLLCACLGSSATSDS